MESDPPARLHKKSGKNICIIIANRIGIAIWIGFGIAVGFGFAMGTGISTSVRSSIVLTRADFRLDLSDCQ
jgi:hypothetical protein